MTDKKYLTKEEYDTLDDDAKIIARLNGSAPNFNPEWLHKLKRDLDLLKDAYERNIINE